MVIVVTACVSTKPVINITHSTGVYVDTSAPYKTMITKDNDFKSSDTLKVEVRNSPDSIVAAFFKLMFSLLGY